VIVRQSFMLAIFHLGMKIRVSLCSLMYRKVSAYFIHIYTLRTSSQLLIKCVAQYITY
jgi:hypothetical protein